MKDLEGQKVYLLPTGNNARRGNPNRIEEAVITKVARVFINFKFVDLNFDNKYRYEKGSNHISNDHNGGYLVFGSKAEVEEYKNSIELTKKISDNFRYQSDWMSLSYRDIKKVAEILGIK
jgi:hypothetical protein